MFLKRIDVVGFKSFADKTQIEFAPGITAVVGPNGSGKSNIADAIRWVLGEQSARNLRGAKMEDVIFAGTETRRSVNYCEVSLTLDNADHHLPVVFDEVTVTRRVYRSGDSEYMINRQTCRLKDIAELFMDSGLGRESYSIIGQGRIEEMLSTRAEDRRGPFEDAAGIVKYKHRRREAERKLDETAANLLRVDDILAELERQAGPLQKEAERTRQFQQWDDELKRLDVSVLVHEIEQLQARWKRTAADVQDLSRRRQQVAAELVQTETAATAARTALDARTQALEALQQRLVERVEDRQRTEGSQRVLEERLQHARQNLVEKQQERTRLAEERAEYQTQHDTAQARVADVRGQLELKLAELEVAVDAVDPARREALEREIERFQADLIDTHNVAAGCRNEIKMAEESLSLDQRKQDRLQEERTRWETEALRWQTELERLQAQDVEMAQREQSLLNEVDECGNQTRVGVETERKLAEEVNRLQSQAASARSRLELLRELEEGYDGYALGVKTVLLAANKKQLQGVLGSVASLIAVPPAYEVAMETALGASLQNIVVKTEADARAAIDMLKRRQAGRATFMPLSVIKSRLLRPHDRAAVTNAEGFVGIASDLIGYDETHRAICEHLLGNVVIASDLVHANDLARRLDYKVRVVTLEGDVVSPGGIMAGGSHQRKGPGLLGRQRERTDLERQVQENERDQRQLTERQKLTRAEVAGWQERRQQASARAEQLRTERADTKAGLREVAARHTGTRERLDGVSWEAAQLDSGRSAWEERAQRAREELTQVEARLAQLDGDLAARRLDLQARDRSVNEAQERVTAAKVTVATLRQEQSTLEERFTEYEQHLQRLTQRAEQLTNEIRITEQTMTDTAQSLVEERAHLENMTDGLSDLEAQLQALRTERQHVEAEVAQAERRTRDKQLELTTMDEQLHRAEVAAERTDLELNHALRRMGDQYQMTYEWAAQHYTAPDDPEVARKGAERLRQQIASLGAVQLGAIEEWDRLSERMNFLQSERDDLQGAASRLQDVIAEIDAEMSKRFETTFELIRAEFQVLFRQLFNGGHADLELTDRRDLLRAGIEVAAQPPGKKLQNLNLLSGGERALTAMALLFAILRVRPVPFCVLDEVEAALDEANVGRFAQQVRRFSEDTQFILITHRRGTMEEADVLYGVTMQESGISSLVGVRLHDTDDFESA